MTEPAADLPAAYAAARCGYGCMRIAGDAERGRAAVLAAWEAGYRLFDHADIYAGGRCEELFGSILRDIPDMREQIVLQSKIGIRFREGDAPGRYDFSREHLQHALEGSLRRLGVERLDVLLLHRIDLLADPRVVGELVADWHARGLIGAFGVSNASPSQLRMLQAHCPLPLVANQIEINLDRIDAFSDGSLDQCLELGISPQAWCPMARLGYRAWGGHAGPAQWRLVELELDRQAERYGCDPTAIALAWLLRHPAGIVPLIGSCTAERIRAARQAEALTYEHTDWYRLLEARNGRPVP
ncbi:MAG: aldo/keto reductase [Planctomycetota bacterium]